MAGLRLISQTRNRAGAYVAVLIHMSGGTVLCGWLCSGCTDGEDVPAGTPTDLAARQAERGRDAHAATCDAPPHD